MVPAAGANPVEPGAHRAPSWGKRPPPATRHLAVLPVGAAELGAGLGQPSGGGVRPLGPLLPVDVGGLAGTGRTRPREPADIHREDGTQLLFCGHVFGEERLSLVVLRRAMVSFARP